MWLEPLADLGKWLKSEMEYGRDLTRLQMERRAYRVGRSCLRTERRRRSSLALCVRASWAPTAMGIGVEELDHPAGAAPKANPAGRRGPGRRRRRGQPHRLCRLGNPPGTPCPRSPAARCARSASPADSASAQDDTINSIIASKSPHPTGEPPLRVCCRPPQLLLLLSLFVVAHAERSEGPHRRSKSPSAPPQRHSVHFPGAP